MSKNDSIGAGNATQMLPISEADEQFYLQHPDHAVRAQFIARRLAQPGSNREEFNSFVNRVLEGINHEDV